MSDLNEQLRAEFEKLAESEFYIEHDGDGEYKNLLTRCAWDGFKLARRTPASPAVQPVGEHRARYLTMVFDMNKPQAQKARELLRDAEWDRACWSDAMTERDEARAALSPATVQAGPSRDDFEKRWTIIAAPSNRNLFARSPSTGDYMYSDTQAAWQLYRAAPALHAAAGADVKDAARLSRRHFSALQELFDQYTDHTSSAYCELSTKQWVIDDARAALDSLAAIASSAEEVKP